MSSITSEQLHAKGYRPDGKGGLLRLPADQWAEKHSKRDHFDNGCGESRPVQLSTYAAPSVNADQGVIDVAAAGRAGGSRSSARPVVNSRPQIRVPKRRVPNRTENLYQGEARRRWPDCELRYEAFAFILPSGCRYCPDWTAWRGAELVAVVEVKGGYLHPNSTRSIHAWKEAAAAWPAVRFVFAQWKDGAWNETEVVPV